MHNPDWLLPQNISLTVEVHSPVGLTATEVCLPTCSDIGVGVSKQRHDESDALWQALQGLLFLGHLLQKGTPRQKTFTVKGRTSSENPHYKRTHLVRKPSQGKDAPLQKTFIAKDTPCQKTVTAKGLTSSENLHCERTRLDRKPSLWKGHTLSKKLSLFNNHAMILIFHIFMTK